MNNKNLNAIIELNKNKTVSKKEFGNSMLPIILSGSLITYEKQDEYFIGDIAFCKISGKFYCHLICGKRKVKDKNQYQISNNKGKINGWTFNVYGKAIKASLNGTEYFNLKTIENKK